MTNRIIEISDPLVSLSMLRGFLLVKVEGVEKARIAFEDIGILILNGTGATSTLKKPSPFFSKFKSREKS